MLTGERFLLQASPEETLRRSTPRYILRTLRKLKKAFIVRSLQANRLAESIKSSPYPVILAGDFNDTPASYAYHIISKGLNNAFVLRGKGFSRTYVESKYPLRIDHILSSKSMKPRSYRRPALPYSDHFPVIVSFDLSKESK